MKYVTIKSKEFSIDIKDMPNWVKNILSTHKIKGNLSYEAVKEADIGGNWHDANVRTIYLYEKGKIKQVSGAGGVSPNDSKEERLAKQGFKTVLVPDRMVLVVNSYPKSAKLYVHPDAMGELLDDKIDANLSAEELLALLATKQLKSSYRRDELSRFGVKYDDHVAALKKKGLLSNSGGITTTGRNVIENELEKIGLNAISPIMQVAKKLGFKDKYFN